MIHSRPAARSLGCLDVHTALKQINDTGLNSRRINSAVMALIAKRMLQLTIESPHQIKDLTRLGRLFLANRAQDLSLAWLHIDHGQPTSPATAAAPQSAVPPDSA